MNMGEYGGRLQAMGLRNLEAMAELENQRQQQQYAADQQQAKAKAEAVGGMVGGLAGAAKGYYEKKKGDHATTEAARRTRYEEQKLDERLSALAEHREPVESEPFQPETFDFMNAMKKDLVSINWMDE